VLYKLHLDLFFYYLYLVVAAQLGSWVRYGCGDAIGHSSQK